MYDTIIIGSGPAGITSAIYAKRLGLNVLIIYKGLGTLKNAKKNRKLLWISRNFRR